MIRLAIRRPVAVAMAYAAIALLGWAAWRNVPLELLPETSLPQLTVQAQWPGSSPEAMEAFVTSPLEGVIQQLAGVEKVMSTSQAGMATIQVEFARAADMDFSRLELSERLAALRDQLPARVTPTVIPYVPQEFREQQRPFLEYTVTGPYTPEALRAHVQDVVRPEITQVDGVADVEVHGGRDRLLEIALDRGRVEALGLAPQAVQQRVLDLEYVKEAGVVDVAGSLRTVAIRHRAESVQEILELPVLTDRGRIVRLGDVARVHDTYEDARQYYRIDGFPAVSFTVHKELGTNVVEVADAVKARLAGVTTLHPPGTRVILDEDESEAVRTQLSDLRTRALVAGVVIFAVLLLFLGSLRSAGIVFATIAFSVLITVNLIYFGGLTLNVLTLMGIAMGFGLIVDNAIVVLENVYRRRKLGDAPEVAAERGAREVVLPILAATLTTVVVLVPFVYLQGELQVYYVPLAIVVGFSLVASLFVAFSFIPGLASRVLGEVPPDAHGQAVPEIARAYAEELTARHRAVTERRRERWRRWRPRLARLLPWHWHWSAALPWKWRAHDAGQAVARVAAAGVRRVAGAARRVAGRGPSGGGGSGADAPDSRTSTPDARDPTPDPPGRPRPPWYIRVYASLVGFTLRHPVVTVALALAMLGGSYHVFDRYVTRGVLWSSWWGQANYIDLQVRMPRGEELERVDALTRYFEARLSEMPEVERFVTRVYPSFSRTEVTFPDSLELTGIPASIKEQLLAYSHQFGGMDVRVYGYGPSFYGGGGTPPNYSIQVFGYNYDKVREIAEDLGQRLTRFSRIREVDTNSGGRWVPEKETELVLSLDRERLALHDLTARDAVWQVAAATQSAARNQPLRVGGEEVQFAVKLAGSRELDLLELQELLVPSPNGSAVRLGEVARLDERAVLSRIEREDQKYKRFIAYEFMGPSKLGDMVQEAVIGNTFLPPGYSIETGSNWRWDDDERRQILGVLIIAVLLVFMVTAALFESLRQPLTVLLTVPMALVGVFLIFFYTGASFTREAYVGVIMMGGVVVNNAILLVDHINQLRRTEGMALEPATLRGTLERVRPILMTSATTIMGLLPLVLFSASANENIWNALAYALIGGLASSTVLVLTVTPALYLMFERRPERRRLATANAGGGRVLSVVAAFVLAGSASGCERSPAERPAAEDGVALERVVQIGEITGDENYQFGHVSGVAGDASGRIYVSDRMGSFVRVYSGSGEFLQQIGREGSGPGEFQHPSDLFFDDAGRLWVRDGRRVTVLEPRSAGAVPDSVVATRPFSGYTNWTSTARSRLIDGIYYYPDQTLRRGETDRYYYIGYDDNGAITDTIHVPGYETLQSTMEAYYMVSAGSGRMVRGLNRAPFEPAAAWELTPRGTVLGGAGESVLVETDRGGDTLRTIRLPGRRAVAAGERADSAAALQDRLDSIPVPLREVQGVSERVRSGVLPDSVPGFLAVHTGPDGEVWVRRWPPAGQDGTWFDVYSADGELVGHFTLPQRLAPEPPPFIDGERLIGVVHEPETGVHQVMVYRRPPGA